MMNKNLIGERIRIDKDKIIRQYVNGVDILILAKRYDVLTRTLCAHMRRWGVKIRQNDYRAGERAKEQEPDCKMKVSPELLAQREFNTLINNKKIKGILNF